LRLAQITVRIEAVEEEKEENWKNTRGDANPQRNG
jgi:hypothetical protein